MPKPTVKPSPKPTAKPSKVTQLVKTATAPTAKQAPPSLPTLMHEAAAHMAVADHGSAMRVYRAALAQAPNNAGAAFGLAVLLNRLGNSQEALQWLQRLQRSVGKLRTKETATLRAGIWAQVGLAQQHLGQLPSALEAFQAAYKLAPTPELTQRIEHLKPLANSPQPVQQLILHARQQVERNALDDAYKSYVAALQLHPDNPLALHGLAMVQRQRGFLIEALPLLQKAMVLLPERPDFFNDLGMLFQDRGELAQAVSFHKRALKLNPSFTWARLNLGVAYKRLGHNDDALATYQAVLSAQPHIPEVHNNLGNLLRTMGRHAEARACLLQALALRPTYADALANLQELDAELAAAAALTKKAPPRPPVTTAKPVASKTIAPKQASTRASAKKSTKPSVVAKAPAPKTNATPTKKPSIKPVASKTVAVKSATTRATAQKLIKKIAPAKRAKSSK
jgi:tetratricopeptide (TPR) repeat protein